ncbi:hypothetical protein FALBO_6208 [Fusarium albosuccineum]|uniref:DUF6546 domain-containing protein n=1 Tax=Fusarium albosuccineum TaxID=1237068 RepID=A0A8H4PDJ7_9HYPO|nr:hypothetical protein FALBO_6208 [Fusarium albosuccineum]
MPSYINLPLELQRMILEDIAQSPSLAPYACVNKQWQAYFEAKTFRNLVLHQDDLEPFSIVFRGIRRGYLKHLWLRIQLPEYPLPKYKEVEDSKVLWEADRTFTTSVFDLWDELAEWDARGRGENEGLTLELTAHSPSDRGDCPDDPFEKEAWQYKEYLATGSVTPYESEKDVYAPFAEVKANLTKAIVDPAARAQRWERAVNDLFGWKSLAFNYHEEEDMTYVNDDDTPELPEVTVVTNFLVRRQQFREIHPDSLGKMISSLPCLDKVNIERWRCADAKDEKHWCEDAKVTFGMDLPRDVKTLSLYGDTNSIFHDWNPKDANTIALAKSLKLYSKDLENLSVSFLIDAKDFLKPFWPAHSDHTTKTLPDWENLKTLSLTSAILASSSAEHINKLLCAAARAVKKMPNLHLLELWSGAEGQACVFRYRVVDTVTEITWMGTHIFGMDPEVVRAWNEVSLLHGRSDFRTSWFTLDPDKIIAAGTVLRLLDLREQILHPVSGYGTAWGQSKTATTNI